MTDLLAFLAAAALLGWTLAGIQTLRLLAARGRTGFVVAETSEKDPRRVRR